MDTDRIESLYRTHCATGTAIAAHLPRLRELASRDEVSVAVEFGVKRGASSCALLLGGAFVLSYDIAETREARALEALAGERWHYVMGDSLGADFSECDLLFVDSQHDYAQCKAELEAHANKVAHYLVFHDTITFGSIGARGETGEQAWQYRKGLSCPENCLGIRPAIDELMIRDPSWRIEAHYTDSHGLLVLRRV